MYVDEQTMNILGQRADGSQRDELIVRVYASPQPGEFTLYEDDGATIAYQQGEVRKTIISQQLLENHVTVTISATSGTYQGALAQRDNVIRLVVNKMAATAVTLNHTPLPQLAGRAEFDRSATGWVDEGQNVIVAKSGRLDVGVAKVFEFSLLSADQLALQPQPAETGELQPKAAISLWHLGLIVAVLTTLILASVWMDLVYNKRGAK
jgi:hypothetical protein